MIKRAVSLLLIGVLFLGLFVTLTDDVPFGVDKTTVAHRYIYEGVNDTGASNLVTAIVVNYRGFDTFGEVTVLFVAATGIGAVLYNRSKPVRKRSKTEASLIVRTSSKILFPMMILFGTYIFIHGHLTPGGGFQGGAIIATGFVFKYIADTRYEINHRGFTALESVAGMTFATVGILGLIIAGYFLFNFLPNGTPGDLISAGVIPIIYIAIGLKVGAELTGIIDSMMEVSP